MSSITYPFIFFRVKGIHVFPKTFPLTLHEIPTTPTLISPCLSPSTHMSKFFFPIKKWQKMKQKYTIWHLYFYYFPLSTNPLSISASSESNYFSFHSSILPSRLNDLWMHLLSLDNLHIQFKSFCSLLILLHLSKWLLTPFFSKLWSPCLF